MAYVKNKNGFEIGDWVTTTKKVDSCAGYFEKGTKVKVIGISYRGYDLEDENGNRIIETGYDSIGWKRTVTKATAYLFHIILWILGGQYDL